MSRDNDAAAFDLAHAHLNRLARLFPAVRAHLNRELTILDGQPAGTDTPKVTHTAELTPVEAVASQRIHLGNLIDDYSDRLNTTLTVLRQLDKDMTRTLGTRTPAPRCTGGTGRDGNIEWGRPDCWDIPARGPLCIPCYHRERRWRQDHGLPTRDTDAA